MTRHAACLSFNDDDVNHLGDLTNRLARSHPDGEPARDSPMMVFWVWVRLVTVTDQRFLGTRRATSLPRVPPAPPRRFDPYPSPASRVDVAMVPPDVTDIELMRDEAGGLLYEAGIATVTFFRGDIVAASRALRAQFDAVARLNPWLAGRLVRDKTSRGKLVLRHPVKPTQAHVDAVFACDHASNASGEPSLGVTYAKLCGALFAKKRVVPAGTALVNRPDAPVAMLRLARSPPNDDGDDDVFSLTFSLSHSVGDGRTYYEILKMLTPGAKVAALDATRRHAFSEDMRDVCNRDALRWIDSVDAGCMFGCSMLPSLFGFGKKARCVAFVLDKDGLAEAKRAGAAASGAPFVSTNDVLTSAFFNACDNRVGLMGLDCRGRVDGVASDAAGNYVTALVLDDDVFASPGGIRAMLGRVPYETTKRPFPSCAKWCAGMDRASAGMVTNWSSFAGDLVQIPDCELLLHLPVKHPDAMMFDCAIPFASRPGELSVLCWTISTDEAGLREALPVGDVLSDALFPALKGGERGRAARRTTKVAPTER